MANLQEKGRMSLKDGKKGDGERNERIAVGSGARETRRGVSARERGMVEVRAGWLAPRRKRGCTAGGSLFLCLLRL